MAQLLETNAGSLRVEGDIYRKWSITHKPDSDNWSDKGESFNQSVAPLEDLVDRLLFSVYELPIEVVSTNVERNPKPVVKDGKTTYPYFTFKYYEKTWNGSKYVTTKYTSGTNKGKPKTFTKDGVIPDTYIPGSFQASNCALSKGTLHFYFTAKRGLPKLFGDGNMYGGRPYRSGGKLDSEGYWTSYPTIKEDANNKKKQIWEQYKQNYNESTKKWVWVGLTGKTATQEKNPYADTKKYPNNAYTLAKTSKLPKRRWKYRRKKYWSPVQVTDSGIRCRSYNHIGRVISYPRFQGDITNERIGTIRIYDKKKRIQSVKGQGFSNAGASGSGAASFFVKDIKIKSPTEAKKDKALASGVNENEGQYIYMDIYLSALDNRTYPTTNLNAHVNLPVLLNVLNYE